MSEHLNDSFDAGYYQATLGLLLSGDEPTIKAALSNNFNTIISALRIAIARAALSGSSGYEAGIEAAAKVADAAGQEVAEKNADRYWQSERIAKAIRSLLGTTAGDAHLTSGNGGSVNAGIVTARVVTPASAPAGERGSIVAGERQQILDWLAAHADSAPWKAVGTLRTTILRIRNAIDRGEHLSPGDGG